MLDSEIITVVVDDGHFNVKGAIMSESFEPVRYTIPSMVLTGYSNNFLTRSNDISYDLNTEDVDGKTNFYNVVSKLDFGSNEFLLDTQNSEFQLSAANRVLVHSMLYHMGLKGKKVRLYATSPMQRYFHSDGSVNEDYIKQRNDNLKKPVFLKDNSTIEIVEVTQIPEGFATYLSILMKPNKAKGTINIDTSVTREDVLILDFGGQTLDVAVVSNGKLVVQKSYTEEGMGMLKIHDRLYDYLKSYRRNISREEMSRVIETGVFATDKKGTNKINVSERVHKVVRDVLSAAMDKVSKRTPTHEFDRVIIGGGGAQIIEREIKLYIDGAEMVRDPLHSNAIGTLYMATSEVSASQKNAEPA